MRIICPECGFEDEGNFCSNCGTSLQKIDISEQKSLQIPPESSWLDKCPVCKSGKLSPVAKKKLFGLAKSENFECSACGAEFSESGEGYRLTKVPDASNSVWQEYGNQVLIESEWKCIAHGGMSSTKQREMDLECWMAKLKDGEIDLRMKAESPILLKKNEELILSFPKISLWEPRSVTRGGSAGTSIRVAKGLRVRVGGFQAESHEELRNIDQGTLTLTDKRIVFSGTKRTTSVPLTKIISMEPYNDAISIRREGKEKIQSFAGINQASITFAEDGREYKEPFSGLIFMYIVEGLVK